MRNTRPRVATALVLMPVMLAFLGMVGASAFGKPKPSVAQYQYKVTICHKTGSASNPGVTITVNANAVAAHVTKHGDTLGECAPNLPSSNPSSNSSEVEGQGKGNGQGQGSGQGNQGNGKGKTK
jgi:hypothetical protein